MVEPEGLLIEGARRATVVARELWWRARPPGARGTLPLAHVRRRLELFVAALFGDVPPIVPVDPPPPATWLERVLGRAPRRPATALPATDGMSVWLPRAIETVDSPSDAVGAYRLWAVEQTARAVRGTPRCAPADALERDLYWLCEAVAVDADLALALPGLTSALRAARAVARDTRPTPRSPTGRERVVNGLVQRILSSDPTTRPSVMTHARTPRDSLLWARAMAVRLRGLACAYRGIPPVALWGELRPAPRDGRAAQAVADVPDSARRPRTAALRRRPRVRHAADDEDDREPGTWMVRADEAMQAAEDPAGLQRPIDGDDDADTADLADSVSDLPEARVVQTPARPREVLESDATPTLRAAHVDHARDTGGAAIAYPEWDHRIGAYREPGAIVHTGVVAAGSGAWVESVMVRHAALVRRVRRRFEALRPRRTSVGRQPDGADLDLAAYVTAFGDWRAGGPADDRLYVAARPARRDLAIVLLVDVSASTDSWVSGTARVIDVEKESLVVLLEALDALGDRHAALAFCGNGPGEVRVHTVKRFDERAGVDVRRRVAGLEPDGYTRVGAAVRHASALFDGQAARHRLLLVLSDGKPNDVDRYEGRYGIEDTRQAVAEARLQGLVVFCLTVDRDAPTYMPSIFGPRGYTMLRRQDLLPAVVVDVVRRLLAA
jgi:nitric oxide reductase NorD protein